MAKKRRKAEEIIRIVREADQLKDLGKTGKLQPLDCQGDNGRGERI